MSTRINKHLAELGYCSRRRADELIADGKVKINGRVAKLGDQVADGDTVSVSGEKKKTPQSAVYLLLNKPVGIICTADRRRPDNIMDFVRYPKRVYPVGRLDVESAGLILLTNDGVFANRLMHPKYEHEKEYVVETELPLSKADIGKLAGGILLEGKRTLKTKVRRLGSRRFAIILTEGRNRQIRRMVELLGNRVVGLTRTRILTLKLGNDPVGKWRHLTQGEIRDLKRAVGLKTE